MASLFAVPVATPWAATPAAATSSWARPASVDTRIANNQADTNPDVDGTLGTC
jgi:hypothetical protein